MAPRQSVAAEGFRALARFRGGSGRAVNGHPREPRDDQGLLRGSALRDPGWVEVGPCGEHLVDICGIAEAVA
jgi:hypothetical protein